MNCPVWEVACGEGLPMALVSIPHVFVSHFASGGLFLAPAERRALRPGESGARARLRAHTSSSGSDAAGGGAALWPAMLRRYPFAAAAHSGARGAKAE